MIDSDEYVFPSIHGYKRGLTKREYFAAVAMGKMIAERQYLNDWENRNLAKEAVSSADALIAELNKEPSK